MTTIGVITTCYSYQKYIPEWVASVNGLNRTPDKVVIATTDTAHDAMAYAKDNLNCDFSVVQTKEPWVFAKALNDAVAQCDTDWIVWIGVDDIFLPHALDGWEDSEKDMITFGLTFPDNSYIRTPDAPTAEQVIDLSNGNLIPCGSPFKRSLWEKSKFDGSFTPLEDWVFGVDAALNGATFGTTGRVDFIYRVHDQQQRPDERPFTTKLSRRIKRHAAK